MQCIYYSIQIWNTFYFNNQYNTYTLKIYNKNKVSDNIKSNLYNIYFNTITIKLLLII